jgi:hypothetical protein
MTEFMQLLHTKLTEGRNVATTTADSYIGKLKILNRDVPFKSLSFLKNTDVIDELLVDYKTSTKQAYYSTLVSVLSLFVDKENGHKSGYKSAYNHYTEKMNELSSENRAEKKKNKKTDTQTANWIPWADIINKRDELGEVVEKYDDNKKPTHNQFNNLLNHFVLSLYTYIPPRRNQDYQQMEIVKVEDDDDAKLLPTNMNYLIIKNDVPDKFIFNVYKTARLYGQQTVDIPEELHPIILRYVRHHPKNTARAKRFHMLVSPMGTKLEQNNTITRILNKIFKLKMGASMLRHIYLSDKYDIVQMEDDAEKMGHSIEQQREYIKK